MSYIVPCWHFAPLLQFLSVLERLLFVLELAVLYWRVASLSASSLPRHRKLLGVKAETFFTIEIIIKQLPLFHQEVGHHQSYFHGYPQETSSAIASPTKAGMAGSEQEQLGALNRPYRERDSLSRSCCLESHGLAWAAFLRTIELVLYLH